MKRRLCFFRPGTRRHSRQRFLRQHRPPSIKSCGRTQHNKTHVDDFFAAAAKLQSNPLSQRFMFVAESLFPEMLRPCLLADRDFRDIAEDSVWLLAFAAWIRAAKAQEKKLSKPEGNHILHDGWCK